MYNSCPFPTGLSWWSACFPRFLFFVFLSLSQKIIGIIDVPVGFTFRMLHPCSKLAIKTHGAGGHSHTKIDVSIVSHLPKAKLLVFPDVGSHGGVEIRPQMGEVCPSLLIIGTMFHNLNFLSINCQIEATTKEGPRRLQLPLIV